MSIISSKKLIPEELRHGSACGSAGRPAPGLTGVFADAHDQDVLIGRVRELATPAVSAPDT